MNKKISVIIPVYNTSKLLRRCLDSVINQTYKNLEIILINDGSTDDSLSICKEYSQNDSRIILIDKENEGGGKARNAGLDRATGDYIAFVDSDDYIDPDMYSVLMNNLKTSEADISTCGRIVVREGAEKPDICDNNFKCFSRTFSDFHKFFTCWILI